MLKMTIRPGGTGLCPICYEGIQRKAMKCPHCHSDLSRNQQWMADQSKNGNVPVLVAIMVVSYLGAVLFYFGFL